MLPLAPQEDGLREVPGPANQRNIQQALLAEHFGALSKEVGKKTDPLNRVDFVLTSYKSKILYQLRNASFKRFTNTNLFRYKKMLFCA